MWWGRVAAGWAIGAIVAAALIAHGHPLGGATAFALIALAAL